MKNRNIRVEIPLVALLALCIGRLWLMQLPSSFWVDEMATVFVVHHGAADPSLTVAPQVASSLYYWLPRLVDRLIGISEIGYRLPSILAMCIALWLVGRLAARLIHPAAGWFAAIVCLGLRTINYHAAEARPYALGICLAAAALWFLVRWLDTATWRNGLLFAIFAALILWVHLIYWPFYAVLSVYGLARLLRKETPVTRMHAAVVFGILGLILLPALIQAIGLFHEARNHVIIPLPTPKQLVVSFQARMVLICGIAALMLHFAFRWRGESKGIAGSSLALIAGWWMCQPVGLALFSYATGYSVFVPRYLSLSLPAVGLAATVVVSYLMPREYWRPAALALAAGVLLMKGSWTQTWPVHDDSNWRDAAHAVNQAVVNPGTPVLCPSPFIEAQWPAWRPDYKLPGFLYCHLEVYPIRGQTCLFPFTLYEIPQEAEQYAESLCRTVVPASGRFIIYGGRVAATRWREWFAARPDLANWSNRKLGKFDGVDAVIFEKAVGSGPMDH